MNPERRSREGFYTIVGVGRRFPAPAKRGRGTAPPTEASFESIGRRLQLFRLSFFEILQRLVIGQRSRDKAKCGIIELRSTS